ncbi:hypothetical protein M3484_22885 [Pseudomonas sp. GX19020]|uniref:hypothetical protein n=1 Tax=Pseudomonas sp. GX19020 TaxID=2942277 RepID=UPI002018AB94|nr:hypothetical protein [Pseudomonas sp. GX19020]MCL4069408.1 hypothetical protein [Pseudomonas sp. GX19020]
MGSLHIDSTTKGFDALSPLAQSDTNNSDRISPALSALLTALRKEAPTGEPVEIVIGVMGKQQTVYSVTIQNAEEIKEILEWTIGQQ